MKLIGNSNRLFGAIFCFSLFLHGIVITAVPVEKLLKTGTPLLHDGSGKEPDSEPLEFELESLPEVPNKEEKAPLQEKRLSFIDTSDNPIEEEPQGDTDKIGIKATVARDTYEGKEETNNQPRAEGNSDALFLSKGETPFDETSPSSSEDSEEQNEPVEMMSENLAETESQLSETDAAVSLLEPPEADDKKDGDSDEDKEGLEHIENPTSLAQLKSEVSEMKSIETPSELEDLGERVPIFTPPKRQKMGQESGVKRQEFEPKTQGLRPKTKTPSGKKINIGAKKGSPVIYEDTISNAPLYGEESFNVQRHEYAEYFQHIRDKIAWYWFLSYGHDQSIKLETRNRLPIIIEFKVLPSGMMDDVEIIDEAGNSLLAARIQQAIQATRLKEFPPYIKEDFIDVRFNFYFF